MCGSKGRTVAKAVSRRLPTTEAPIMWDLWRTKWHWGRFSLVSPANHSADCSTLFIVHFAGRRWPACRVASVSPHRKEPRGSVGGGRTRYRRQCVRCSRERFREKGGKCCSLVTMEPILCFGSEVASSFDSGIDRYRVAVYMGRWEIQTHVVAKAQSGGVRGPMR
jgi:hypothetical protein